MEYENLPLQKMGALRLKFTVFPYSKKLLQDVTKQDQPSLPPVQQTPEIWAELDHTPSGGGLCAKRVTQRQQWLQCARGKSIKQ